MISPTWRRLGAAGIVLGFASLIATTIIQWFLPAGSDSPIATIDAHPRLWNLVSILGVFGPLVWALGTVAAIALAPHRGRIVTTAGGIATAVGLGAGVGHLALYFGLFGDLAASGVDDAAVEAVSGADAQSLISTALLMIFLAGFTLGLIVFTIGLRRARSVPVWVPVAAVVAAVANFVGGPIAGTVQLLALTAVLLPIISLLAGHQISRAAASADDLEAVAGPSVEL